MTFIYLYIFALQVLNKLLQVINIEADMLNPYPPLLNKLGNKTTFIRGLHKADNAFTHLNRGSLVFMLGVSELHHEFSPKIILNGLYGFIKILYGKTDMINAFYFRHNLLLC